MRVCAAPNSSFQMARVNGAFTNRSSINALPRNRPKNRKYSRCSSGRSGVRSSTRERRTKTRGLQEERGRGTIDCRGRARVKGIVGSLGYEQVGPRIQHLLADQVKELLRDAAQVHRLLAQELDRKRPPAAQKTKHLGQCSPYINQEEREREQDGARWSTDLILLGATSLNCL